MKQNFSDLIGSEMGRIIDSDEHKNLFTAPVSMKKEAQLSDPNAGIGGPGAGVNVGGINTTPSQQALNYDPTRQRGHYVESPELDRGVAQQGNPNAPLANRPLPIDSSGENGLSTQDQRLGPQQMAQGGNSKVWQWIDSWAKNYDTNKNAAGPGGAIAKRLSDAAKSKEAPAGGTFTITPEEAKLLRFTTPEQIAQLRSAGIVVSAAANVKDMVRAIAAIANDLASIGYTTSEMVAGRLLESIAMETTKAIQKKAEDIVFKEETIKGTPPQTPPTDKKPAGKEVVMPEDKITAKPPQDKKPEEKKPGQPQQPQQPKK